MPPPAFLDPARLDLDHPIATRVEIDRVLPQRHEFSLLDAVLVCDQEKGVFAGYHDVKPDAWWTRAHIPGRPLFPGVLMIESAAQLSAFVYRAFTKRDVFLGFSGVDGVKYRGSVEPPCRFVIVGESRDVRPRRVITDLQGFVGQQMVFEARITGMPI
ncbi:MAG: beta-hydroxyacyl-ACP dehydratase [Phycisphaerae bacterium]|nr:beta-hydroxyacyl-ACP dehydratase [Phycisphaerae bacterium]